MKNNILYLLLAITLSSYSQKQIFTIVSVNNQTYATKKYKQKNEGISFKDSNGVKILIIYSEIDKIVSVGKKDNYNYTLKPIRFSEKKSVFMKEIITGEVSMYERNISDLILNNNSPNNFDNELRYKNYYLIKKNQQIAELIDGGSINYLEFKNNCINYFKDCDSLVAKVKNNKGKLIKLEDLVVYHNENCN